MARWNRGMGTNAVFLQPPSVEATEWGLPRKWAVRQEEEETLSLEVTSWPADCSVCTTETGVGLGGDWRLGCAVPRVPFPLRCRNDEEQVRDGP